MDSLLKRSDDQPTIGLLLCRDKNNIEVEFTLRDMNKPMGVSEYTLVETLPDNLKGALPMVEEIESDFPQTRHPGMRVAGIRWCGLFRERHCLTLWTGSTLRTPLGFGPGRTQTRANACSGFLKKRCLQHGLSGLLWGACTPTHCG